MTIFNKEKFAEEILKKRTVDGYPLRELGEVLKINYSVLNKYERGIHIPKIPHFLILCDWIKFKPCSFFIKNK
jgi:transcriptional regulator with XRE-family HTH domain